MPTTSFTIPTGKRRGGLAAVALAVLCALPALAQEGLGEPHDWTHHHLIFSNPGTAGDAVRNGTYGRWVKIVNDPRFKLQQRQRSSTRPDAVVTLPGPGQCSTGRDHGNARDRRSRPGRPAKAWARLGSVRSSGRTACPATPLLPQQARAHRLERELGKWRLSGLGHVPCQVLI